MSPPVVISVVNDGRPETRLWLPMRPEGFDGLMQRFRIAWLVFTGNLDAFDWQSVRTESTWQVELK